MRAACPVALLAAFAVAASPPIYQSPSFVLSDGTAIDVSYYGSPCVHDWDGDGAKDLILGEFDYGKIRLYLNVWNNPAPVFEGFTYMQADGADISLPYG